MGWLLVSLGLVNVEIVSLWLLFGLFTCVCVGSWFVYLVALGFDSYVDYWVCYCLYIVGIVLWFGCLLCVIIVLFILYISYLVAVLLVVCLFNALFVYCFNLRNCLLFVGFVWLACSGVGVTCGCLFVDFVIFTCGWCVIDCLFVVC